MNWFQRLTKRGEMEKHLDAELRYHYDCKVADGIKAGMSEDEARRSARLEFGGLDQVKEECRDARGTRWLEILVQDARFAMRTLGKSPAFTAAAILTLALGIGANTAVFTVVNSVLLQPLPLPQSEGLFLISFTPQHSVFINEPGLSDQYFLQFQREDKMFDHVATYGVNSPTLTGAGDPVRIHAAAVTTEFFQTLKVAPAIGRSFLPGEGQPGRERFALLSDTLWRNRFDADPSILGRTITLDGVPHIVTGVMPHGFGFPAEAEVWTPIVVVTRPNLSFLRPVVGRLKPGVSPQQAQVEVDAILRRLPFEHGEDANDFAARVTPLKESVVGNIRVSLLIFTGAVALVLLIACANVASLLLVRATSRRHEISVRSALGASRGRIVTQLLTESTLISLTGGVVGVLFAALGVPSLLALAPAGKLPRLEEIHIDAYVLTFTVAISVVAGIAFGAAPAFHATRRELRSSLTGASRTFTGRHGFRNVMVVSEFALALVLLAGAGLMLKSFARMRAVDPGLQPANVLTMTVDLPEAVYGTPERLQSFHQRTLEKLSELPGVLASGAVNWLPLGPGLIRGDFQLEGGRKLPPSYIVDKPVVSPGYFRSIGIRQLKGRDFTDRDTPGSPGVVILSQSVARQLWPGQDPVGKRIALEENPKPQDWVTIVGVVDDVRQQGLTQAPDPAIYQPYLQVKQPMVLSHMTFVLRTVSNPESTAPLFRRVLSEVDRNQAVESISTMADVIAVTTAEPRFQTRVLAVFAFLALVLSAIGIYGVLASSVTERTHEIGIRMALGAATPDVMKAVFRSSLALAAAGVAIGTMGALAITRVLAKFLFNVKPTDPATFIAVASLLVGVALFAAWMPARRATKVDPVVALRFD